MMDEERLDLSALDPTRDAAHWERLVARITASAAPELARRAAAQSSVIVLAAWARPALAAAAVIAVISGAVLASVGRAPQPGTTLSAIDQSEPVDPATGWLLSAQPPELGDLIVAVEGEIP